MAFTPRVETYTNVSSLSTPFDTTVTKPASAATGDILFQFWAWSAATTIDSVPTGWYLVGQNIANTDRYALYFKIVEATEPASWVWSWAATAKVAGVCSCYTAGDFAVTQGSLTDLIVSNTQYRTSDGNVRAASLANVWPDSPLVFFGGVYSLNSSRSTAKPTTPTTEWVEDEDSWSTTPDFQRTVCSYIWTTGGTTGVMNAVLDASATATTKHAFAVALRPKINEVSFTETLSLADVIGKLQPGTVLLKDPHDDLSIVEEGYVGQYLIWDQLHNSVIDNPPWNYQIGTVVESAISIGFWGTSNEADYIGNLVTRRFQDFWSGFGIWFTAITQGNSSFFYIWTLWDDVDSVPNFDLYVNTATGQLVAEYRRDDNVWVSSSGVAVSLATAYGIETYTKYSTAPGANNGEFRVWMNGSEVITMTGLDNDLNATDGTESTLGCSWMDGTTGSCEFYCWDYWLLSSTPLGETSPTLSLADAAAFAEVLAIMRGANLLSLTETLSASDSISKVVPGTVLLSLAEAVGASEPAPMPVVGALILSLADALVAGDGVAAMRLGDLILPLIESVQASDVLSTPAVGRVVLSLADTIVISETLDKTIPLLMTLIETLSAADILSPALSSILATLTDAIALAETFADPRIGPVLIALSDSIVLGEALTPQIGQVKFTLSDAIVAADTLTAPKIGGLQITFADPLSLTDVLTMLHSGVAFSAADVFSINDQLATILDGVKIVAIDGASIVDVLAAKVGSLVITVSDALAASDVLTVTPSGLAVIYVNIADTLTLSEILATLPSGLRVSVLDAIGVSDVLNTTIGQVKLALDEALAFSDVLSTPQVGRLMLSLSETAMLVDALNAAIFDAGLSFVATETLSLAEGVDLRPGMLQLVLAEVVDILDQINLLLPTVSFTASEVLSIADTLAPKIGALNILISDALSIAEGIVVENIDLSLLLVRVSETLALIEWALPLNYRQEASENYDATERHRIFSATDRLRWYDGRTQRQSYEATERLREYEAMARKRYYEAKGN